AFWCSHGYCTIYCKSCKYASTQGLIEYSLLISVLNNKHFTLGTMHIAITLIDIKCSYCTRLRPTANQRDGKEHLSIKTTNVVNSFFFI
ncbi:MAG TPA: hypothetical protein VIP70_13240, partial [Nitrososphaeraceae archaeon]